MLRSASLKQSLRQDLRVLARVECVAVVAFVAANWRSDALLIALVLTLIAWPISLLAPMRWRDQISQQAYMRYSVMFLPGFLGLAAGAYGASRGPAFPGAALVVGFGVVHMAVVWVLVGAEAAVLHRLSPWLGACILGIAGVLADLPSASWSTASFFIYGLVGTATVIRVTSVAVNESRTTTTRDT
jgi:hypothetical protein